MVTLFQKPQLSKVNARHLLDDLASSYSYSLEEAVLVEMIANSLDAKSTNIYISFNIKDRTLTLEDDGYGMSQDDFEKYHDLAESRKERGRGIGFAGLGAKLAHKITRKIVTETRSGASRDSSEWHFKGDDLLWNRTRGRTLQYDGTKITLHLEPRWQKMLNPDFIGDVIKNHYGAMLDPFLSAIYGWESIYPQGIAFYIDGQPLPKRLLLDSKDVASRKEIDILGKNKKRIGRAVFILTKKPLPEDKQGVVIATYGKTIRRDFSITVQSRRPERLTGWFESPGLVECLTLNKQDFVAHGRLGEKFRRIRRELQTAFTEWLKEIGEAREAERRQRAPRLLEQETARILRRIPELRYLFAASTKDFVARPDTTGDVQATLVDLMQTTRGFTPGENGGGEGIAVFPGSTEGQSTIPQETGRVKASVRPRTIRSGPRIERVADLDRVDIGWVEGDSVVINTAHPAYAKAEHLRLLAYHERIAVYYALSHEAPLEPEQKLTILNRALTEWGKE